MSIFPNLMNHRYVNTEIYHTSMVWYFDSIYPESEHNNLDLLANHNCSRRQISDIFLPFCCKRAKQLAVFNHYLHFTDSVFMCVITFKITVNALFEMVDQGLQGIKAHESVCLILITWA